MAQIDTRLTAIQELYSLPLERREIAFVFLKWAGVLLRTQSIDLAFDIAGVLKQREINEIEKTDFSFYTHIHGDHFNQSKALSFHKRTGARIIAPSDIVSQLEGSLPSESLILSEPGRMHARVPVAGLNVRAIRGVHSGPFSQYLIKKNRISIFHAGDSGYFRIVGQSADIAFLPTGTPSPWCAPEVALATALNLKPKIAVAMHGTTEEMERFRIIMKKEMPETMVVIPNTFEPVRVEV
ncbi:MAG: MBL fold metallo-hydrolase [Candidatus Hodarchaeota archaeon]